MSSLRSAKNVQLSYGTDGDFVISMRGQISGSASARSSAASISFDTVGGIYTGQSITSDQRSALRGLLATAGNPKFTSESGDLQEMATTMLLNLQG